MDFRILGPLEVSQDGRSLGLGGAQQRALLAVLLIHRGEVLSTDRLIDELWGERAPSTAVKVVQGYVSLLRKALGDDVILTRGHGYLLAVDSERVDVGRFEALVAGGRSALAAGDAAVGDRRLGEALALWRGEPLADFAYERFAQGEIARLGQARLGALEDRIDAELALGEHTRLVGELEALVREHPLRERLVGQLMVALYRSGRQAEALASYRVARRHLVDELGLEPGRELQELERAILAQDPALESPARGTRRELLATARRRRRGGMLIAAGGAVLLAVLIAAAVRLAGSGTSSTLRVAPNSLAAIDTDTNRVVGQVAVGTRPGAIAFGSGSLWVANLDDQDISRVDPNTLSTLRAIAVGGPPTGIVAAAGRVWVVVSGSTAPSVSARRIDPQFDRIDRTVAIGTVVPGSPGAVAAQGAQVWVAPFSGELTRLSGQTGRVVGHVDPNGAPGWVDVGADAVWMTDSYAGNVIRVDDATGLVTPLAVGPGPSGIAVGEGGIWVAVKGADEVVRIDPGTRAVTATIGVGDAPTGVTVGAGSVWIANSGDGTVTRIDPATNKTIATVTVGGSPQAITVAAGRAWVTVDAQPLGAGGRAAEGGTARLDAFYDPGSMDPAVAYETLPIQLLYATCAKLLNYPDKAGLAGSQLVPEVAQSLPARSADGKSYTFAIRSGFRFSPPSTERVTAQTFKHTIERTLSPAMKSPIAYEFAAIVGAGAYMAGKTAHIAGVTARANTLTIRLTEPAPNLPRLLAQSFFCAVPSNTPNDPHGDGVIPSAGPYRVASNTGQGVVLTRNPNYHGSRPHRLERIELAVRIPGPRAVAQVQAGMADYAMDGEVDSTTAATLAARYGPHSAAARSGHQQYFVNTESVLDYFALNTHRPLFADARLRRAVSYAINRAALARLGDPFASVPEQPTDHYLPPGIPGHVNRQIYPLTPDLTKARQLAKGHAGATAVLYTCNRPTCIQQAQIVKNDLAAIRLRVVVKTFEDRQLSKRIGKPGEPFDIFGDGSWAADYPDPQGVLNPLLEESTNGPTLDDPTYRRRLAAAALRTGPERYMAYARLDADLAHNAVPLVTYGNPSSHELFSARMGCQTYGVYGIDLAALCIKRPAR